jgi:Flp pilus assembly protein TadD
LGYITGGFNGLMIARLAVTAWLALALAANVSCASAAKAEMKQQWDFGVQMARRGAWREALFRFRRSVELVPRSAELHNNLAVAYESTGDYRNAHHEYEAALELDPKNERIRANFDSFNTFYGDLLEDKPAAEPQSGAADRAATPR